MSNITHQSALLERIGVALVIGGAILLAVQITPTLPAYLALTTGSIALLAVSLASGNRSQAAMQTCFTIINSVGLAVSMGVLHG